MGESDCEPANSYGRLMDRGQMEEQLTWGSTYCMSKEDKSGKVKGDWRSGNHECNDTLQVELSALRVALPTELLNNKNSGDWYRHSCFKSSHRSRNRECRHKITTVCIWEGMNTIKGEAAGCLRPRMSNAYTGVTILPCHGLQNPEWW